MPDDRVERLRGIRTFPQLVKYLRDDLSWPIEAEDFDDLVFDWDPEDLGIDPHNAAKIEQIKQLRPLTDSQPWGIFFVKFEPKNLPIVALRRLLNSVVSKKRQTARHAEQRTWKLSDLLFISAYGEEHERHISFAHFSEPQSDKAHEPPSLRVLGWDGDDTDLALEHVAYTLESKLSWPSGKLDVDRWRQSWSDAFILRPREVVQTSQRLAERLAELAVAIRRKAQAILKLENDRGPLTQLYKAFQESLLHDLTSEDFADTYAQTVCYGLFSAAVAKTELGGGDVELAGTLITNPFLREILESFLHIGGRKGSIDFDELGVQEVVDLLSSPSTHLDSILRDFGNQTRQEDPVMHFYEVFLSKYDKKRKVQRGVFYTPQPVVSYIVRSVHELLQTEFGIEDGLASTITWGEMTKKHEGYKLLTELPRKPVRSDTRSCYRYSDFLVEVIDVIHRTLVESGRCTGRKILKSSHFGRNTCPRTFCLACTDTS